MAEALANVGAIYSEVENAKLQAQMDMDMSMKIVEMNIQAKEKAVKQKIKLEALPETCIETDSQGVLQFKQKNRNACAHNVKYNNGRTLHEYLSLYTCCFF